MTRCSLVSTCTQNLLDLSTGPMISCTRTRFDKAVTLQVAQNAGVRRESGDEDRLARQYIALDPRMVLV